MTNETIAAISTPLGAGGIGIIRVSGPQSYQILKRLFVRTKPKTNRKTSQSTEDKVISSHRVYYGFIIEPDTREIIDEVLAIYMKGPKSFTREDVVEIHSHSGFVLLDRILSAVLDAGAVLSAAGDFSKRAFLNGRIDLTQAEAVIDLINAPCETAARIASTQVAGGIRDLVEGLMRSVTALQAKCETAIEFSADMEHEPIFTEVEEVVRQSILPEIGALIQRHKDTFVYRQGLHLAIVGVPNVGKSSLLNQLVEKETAIVSEVPGTTRDIVREYISINGVPVVIFDTAGIHETRDPVECMGIKKARDQIDLADIILLVLEGSRDIKDFENCLIEELAFFNTIVVCNKDDIADEISVSLIKQRIKDIPFIRVSAKFGENIDELKKLIFEKLVLKKEISYDEWVTPNMRQLKLLENAMQELQRFKIAGKNETPLELISEILNNVGRILGEISGKRNKEDLYDHIFSQFCIGK